MDAGLWKSGVGRGVAGSVGHFFVWKFSSSRTRTSGRMPPAPTISSRAFGSVARLARALAPSRRTVGWPVSWSSLMSGFTPEAVVMAARVSSLA